MLRSMLLRGMSGEGEDHCVVNVHHLVKVPLAEDVLEVQSTMLTDHRKSLIYLLSSSLR